MKERNQKLKLLLESSQSENHYIALNLIKHFENGGDLSDLFPTMIDSFQKFITALEIGINIDNFIKVEHVSIWHNSMKSYNQALWLDTKKVDFALDAPLKRMPLNIFRLKGLKKLEIIHQKLVSFDEKIPDLKSLKTVHIIHSDLSLFPKSLLHLRSLETLSLSDNHIRFLPTQIHQLQQLSKLNLSNNKIATLPLEITALKQLKTLNLASNELDKLPFGFQKLENLETLNISNNHFSEFPVILKMLPKLKDVYCKNNPFYETYFDLNQPKVVNGPFKKITIH